MDSLRDPEQARSQEVEKRTIEKIVASDGRGASGLLVVDIWCKLFSNNAV
jgi:hypothetical protein